MNPLLLLVSRGDFLDYLADLAGESLDSALRRRLLNPASTLTVLGRFDLRLTDPRAWSRPALLALAGKAAFHPSRRRRPQQAATTLWTRILAELVLITGRPRKPHASRSPQNDTPGPQNRKNGPHDAVDGGRPVYDLENGTLGWVRGKSGTRLNADARTRSSSQGLADTPGPLLDASIARPLVVQLASPGRVGRLLGVRLPREVRGDAGRLGAAVWTVARSVDVGEPPAPPWLGWVGDRGSAPARATWWAEAGDDPQLGRDQRRAAALAALRKMTTGVSGTIAS